MSTMLANCWTTGIGFLLAVLTYAQGVGPNLPRTRAEWISFVIAALLAGLGVVAKDATTGSRPQ